MKNVVVLVIDRWGAGWMGAYGNTWVETPEINRLAAQSLLIDFVVADSPYLEDTYRAWWSGRHSTSTRTQPPGASWCERFDESVLVTDDDTVAVLGDYAGFNDVLTLADDSNSRTVEHPEDIRLANVLANGLDCLSRLNEPFCLWMHASGMQSDWDAPYEMRERMVDDEDPPPPQQITPLAWEGQRDPDELLGALAAYGGQVAAVDWCLGAFCDVFLASPLAATTRLIVTSPRGFALGEHDGVGPRDDLFGEVLHIPLLVRPADEEHGGALRGGQRRSWLTQPHHLERFALESFDSLIRCDDLSPPAWLDSTIAVAHSDSHRAIRTPAWFMTQRDDEPARLFRKPDDRWEANEISDRCQDVVEQLAVLQESAEQALRDSRPLPKLSPLLAEGLE